MDNNAEKKKAKLLVSPFRLGADLDPKRLLVADLLKRWRELHGDAITVALAIDHGGLWAFNKVAGDLSPREALLAQKAALEQAIRDARERLGLSFSSDPVFFFDDAYKETARQVFCELFEQGLLDRTHLIAPWCPRCRTFLDPDRKRIAREAAVTASTILVSVKGSDKKLPVMFMDPELLGATVALAIHPADKTLGPLAGRVARLPLYGREVKILLTGDNTVPGTVRPVMPAYDEQDFRLAEAHYLSVIEVLAPDGRMDAAACRYADLDRVQARENALNDLAGSEQLGEPVTVQRSTLPCEICDGDLMHRMAEQWVVDMSASMQPPREALCDPAVVQPDSFLKNVQGEADREKWSISRQSDWGCTLPVWTCETCRQFVIADRRPDQCHSCGCNEHVFLTDKLSAGFLAAMWPFAAESWDKEKQTDGAMVLADTLIFGSGEAELAYQTLWMRRRIDADSVPSRVIGVAPGSLAGDAAPQSVDSLRLSYLMKAGACDAERLTALGDFVDRALACAGSEEMARDKLPVLDAWMCSRLIRAASLLERSFRKGKIAFAGDILFKQAIQPLLDIYAPRLEKREAGAVAYILSDFCRWLIPYICILLPGMADTILGMLMGKGFPLDKRPRLDISSRLYDAKLLNRIDAMFRMKAFLGRQRTGNPAYFLNGPAADLTVLRDEAEIFDCAELVSLMDKPLPAGTVCHGTLFGRFVLLESAEESNMTGIIETLKKRSKPARSKTGARKGAGGMAAFIKQLWQYADAEKPEPEKKSDPENTSKPESASEPEKQE